MVSPQELKSSLQSGLAALDLSLNEAQQNQLLAYLSLLDKWNQAYNLSGIRDVGQMVNYHLLDSLAIASFIDGHCILDVGTGAGLPGIPLAISFPEKKFLLLDSNGKKTRFLFQVKTELGLDNVAIFHDRVENFHCSGQIDIVLCRAFAAIGQFIEKTSHILSENTRLLAMKGQYPDEELGELPMAFEMTKSHELTIPGVDGSRHLLEISRVDSNANNVR
jgi:16S rRNA (guanine527-N7)-methyltransferase